MTVLSHLNSVSSSAVLSSAELKSINTSIATLETRLAYYFGSEIKAKFRFGSSTRGTILPRSMDGKSDIDYMVVFSNSDYKPSTYLQKIRRFVEAYYSSSDIFQSSPTIVLNLNHIRFEIVPAIESWYYGLQIPAPASDFSEWIETDPNDFNAELVNCNVSNNSKIKPLVRLLKYWNAQNSYPFESFLLEKEVINMNFWFCTDLKDYFFTAVENLSVGFFAPQWKINAVNRAQNIVAEVKRLESQGLPYSAEEEIKKLIP
ncbi:SMODS domain-containing nucleotidyltransferase [Vibrio cholerae]|uniref:SMODS domain-containing nucleotidyltransferase n=1 Tax=Vibrio cholerae TaxID=666 RepID=UPI001159924E|nr:nucleotidyltransferase [Vibrio cholerae]TQP38240.1 nucleotidyltransferase [Vibrio cholerae]TQP56996.1 nucleotidyltransferase [Vibrio cholerae]